MKRRNIFAAAAAILLIACGAWAFGFFDRPDPVVAELQKMADQAFGQELSEAQQSEFRQQFRQKMDSLSPAQRDAFFDANRDRWMQRMESRMNEFFAMSPSDQQKRLDEIINQMTRPRENRGPNGANGFRGPGGGSGGPTNNAGRGDRGDRGGWANMTEAQRDERAKRRLDQTNPKMRAQFAEFRKKLENRAKERGIPQLPGWGPGGRRG
jgi:hypothetical protein